MTKYSINLKALLIIYLKVLDIACGNNFVVFISDSNNCQEKIIDIVNNKEARKILEVPRNNFLKNYLKPDIKCKVKDKLEQALSEISKPNTNTRVFNKVMNIFEKSQDFKEINKKISQVPTIEIEENSKRDASKDSNENISIKKDKKTIVEKFRYSLDGLYQNLDQKRMVVVFDEPFYNIFSDKEAIVKTESNRKNESLAMKNTRNFISPNVRNKNNFLKKKFV